MKVLAENRSIVLAKRPDGAPKVTDFALQTSDNVPLQAGQFRCRNHYVSLDAGFRNWMNENSGDDILPAMAIGSPVMGLVLGEVIESRHAEYTAGDKLMARFAWQEYSVSDGSDFIARLPAHLAFPPSAYMGVLGDTGMSAYFGMTDIGRPGPGDCVLISGAGGAVGSIAGQLAKIQGAHVVGIVGSQAKADWITTQLGYDAAVIRRQGEPLLASILEGCPNGVDLFFDNVGGAVLEAAISAMNPHGRLVLCGAISGYGSDEPLPGPSNMFDVVTKELKIQGFMTHLRHDRYGEAMAVLGGYLSQGKIKSPEHMLHGIERVPQAFADLFAGRNFGKTIVNLIDQPR